MREAPRRRSRPHAEREHLRIGSIPHGKAVRDPSIVSPSLTGVCSGGGGGGGS